ncbi:serine protease grass [Drosophila ficusphila]|uniref:serine protease grass n=1 Tax=Drosophila ficusphila TaxID=30025 RepID=UPI0007E7ACAF|nr:serine protease grass [Drosophila ficusphila]
MGRIPRISYRILGGRDAGLSLNPWMVYLHDGLEFICGGSLLTNEFVLTAAHCVFPNPKRLIARLGEYDWRRSRDCNVFGCAPGHREYTVAKIYSHSMYGLDDTYDIALLKLNQEVTFSEYIRPICLVILENQGEWFSFVDAQKEFTVTGWGSTETRSLSPTLKIANITQTDRASCHDRYGFSVDHNQICAGDPDGFACTGDSGGPLGMYVDLGFGPFYAQIGIVSFGHYPCSGVSVFTNVVSFTRWIADTIAYDAKFMSPRVSMP